MEPRKTKSRPKRKKSGMSKTVKDDDEDQDMQEDLEESLKET
jgi:hypothetical protein